MSLYQKGVTTTLMEMTCQKNCGYGSDVMDVKQEEHLAPLFFLIGA